MKGKTGWLIALGVAILLAIGGWFIDSHFDNQTPTQDTTQQQGPSD